MATLRKSQGTRSLEGNLEEAYLRYRLELRTFFQLNSRDPQSVDDLMQTMYLQLLKSRSDDAVHDPRNYLFRTAWNVLHLQNRRGAAERKHVTLSVDAAGLETLIGRSNGLWVEDDTSTALTHAELERVLNQLPRSCQVALLRQYRDRRSYKEIAEELGVTVHAVKKYIMRALSHFSIYFNSQRTGKP